ncbi:MAG TPA: hypothetical protein VF997_24690 [Polyangia bacterium]
MRLAIALLLLSLAGCTSAIDDVQIAGADLSATGPDLALPADCPMAFQSPAYCFAGPLGTASSCGACTHVGATCDYFEASLVCACDHTWRCSYAGVRQGCELPDGGIVCN